MVNKSSSTILRSFVKTFKILSKNSFGQMVKSILGDLVTAKAFKKALGREIYKEFTSQELPL